MTGLTQSNFVQSSHVQSSHTSQVTFRPVTFRPVTFRPKSRPGLSPPVQSHHDLQSHHDVQSPLVTSSPVMSSHIMLSCRPVQSHLSCCVVQWSYDISHVPSSYVTLRHIQSRYLKPDPVTSCCILSHHPIASNHIAKSSLHSHLVMSSCPVISYLVTSNSIQSCHVQFIYFQAHHSIEPSLVKCCLIIS